MFIITILFVGCTPPNEKKQIPQEPSEIVTQKTSEKVTPKTTNLMKSFKKALPKAEVVSTAMADLDNDNEEDLIIIFNNPIEPTKITKSNICVITSYSIHALDLSGNTLNYQFAKGSDSLKILQSPTRVSVMLQEVKTKKIIDFQVTMTIDKKENITNFKIKSIEQSNNQLNN